MKTKRAIITGERTFRIEEVDFPKVKGSPIVKVDYVGICGSDIHYWQEGEQQKDVVLGHEYTATVVEPGDSEFKKGDRVLGYTQNPYNEACGVCQSCLEDNPDECTGRVVKIALGCEKEKPGAFSEYVTWFPSGFFAIPEGVSSREAALVEPAAVAVHAVSLSEIKPGDKVLVLGGGIIGQCTAEWARMYGAETVVITEINQRKRERIEEIGIVDKVLDGRAEDLEQQLKEIAPEGFDIFFDCIAIAEPINQAIRSLKRGGTGVLVGITFAPLELDIYETVVFQKRLQGSKGHVPKDFKAVLSAMQKGKLDLEKYITREIKLDDVQQNFEQIEKTGDDIKVLISFD